MRRRRFHEKGERHDFGAKGFSSVVCFEVMKTAEMLKSFKLDQSGIDEDISEEKWWTKNEDFITDKIIEIGLIIFY